MNNQIPIIYLVINWCTKGMRVNFIGLVLLAILFFFGYWVYGKWTTIPEKHFHYNLVKLYGHDAIDKVEIDVNLDYSHVMDENERYPSRTEVKVIRDTSMFDSGFFDNDIYRDHEWNTHNIDSLRDAAVKFGLRNKKLPNSESISSIFLFELSQTCDKSSRMTKSHWSYNNPNTFMFDMGSRKIHFEEGMGQYVNGHDRNSSERDDVTTNVILGGTNSNWDYCSFQLLNDLTAIKSLLALEDISQTNVFVTTEGKGLATVKMYFGATAHFSDMYPKPKEVGRRYIVFQEDKSYPGIDVDFHVEFPEARSLQETRMFFLTTFLSIVITLFLTLSGNTIRSYWRLYKRMSNQTFESPVLPLDNNRTNDDKESQITTTRKRRSRKQKQGI